MRIAIELNGVLRDTLKKIQQEYEKWYLDNPFKEDEEKSEYEVISDLTTLDILKHLKFKDEDELYGFLYREHTMEIFGLVLPIYLFLIFYDLSTCVLIHSYVFLRPIDNG